MNLDQTAHLRSLRHQLRTPINHIIGYAELLLEQLDGEDAGPFATQLRSLLQSGKELLALIMAVLDPAGTPAPDVDLGRMAETLDAPIEWIVRLSEQLLHLEGSSAVSDAASDLARIHAAAMDLLALIHDEAAEERTVATGGAGDAAVHLPAPTDGGSAEGFGGSLLVVDDNEPNRDLIVLRLQRLGYSVSQAEDGRQALERLQTEPVDLILLDIMMPVMDGYQVLAALHADDRLRQIPVIVLSAVDEIESAVRCIEMGADDYLAKPVNAVLLQARIAACLEKKRLRDQQFQHQQTIEAQALELATWNRTLQERVRQQVEELGRLGRLRRFLSPQLAEMIASSGDERLLESHRREITVVFCDLRGFTAFAESAEPEEVMQVLHDYHTALGELIFEYEGTLERFTGDGLMIFFNDPLPCVDPPWRAVQMAVAMRTRVAELQRRWLRLGYDLGFGVGISVGHATLGRIGFEGRYDYAAIGTVTNLSARLCNDATAGQILVSGRVLALVEDKVDVEPVGELDLKGIRRPVSAFNVLGLKEPVT